MTTSDVTAPDATSGANYRPALSMARGPYELDLDADSAGWSYSGLNVLSLEPGGSLDIATREEEWIGLPLEGGFTVTVDGQDYPLRGRANVFAGATDCIYVPRDAQMTVRSAIGGRIAFPRSHATNRLDVQVLLAEDTPTIVRGGGNMTRKVHDFANDSGLIGDRIIACEVYTPGGNWSSYPQHKHDVDSDTESALEEIYYVQVADGPAGPGFAYLRVDASDDREVDVLEEVRSGDVVLVPHGWHGPAIAPPGYDLYYLNVMAGPRLGADRSWKVTFEPGQDWLRKTWPDLGFDRRLIADDPSPINNPKRSD